MIEAQIFRVSRTWMADVGGKILPLTRQDLMAPACFDGRRPGLVRVTNGQAELMELRLKPGDMYRRRRVAA